MATPLVFALDQNFPATVLTLLPKLPDTALVPLRELHPDLVKDHDDWEVLRDLKRRGGVDGFVTLDAKMLNLPKEMVVLQQSRLTLVVFEGIDHDPFVATGLLMLHMPGIVKQNDKTLAQLYVLKRPRLTPENPWNRLDLVARQAGTDAQSLYDDHKLSAQLFLRDR